MIIIYNVILIILTALFLPFILIAFVVQPKFRAGFFQKLGFYSCNYSSPSPGGHYNNSSPSPGGHYNNSSPSPGGHYNNSSPSPGGGVGRGFHGKVFFGKIFQWRHSQKSNKKTVVFHAVSVGETNAIKELVKRYHELHDDEDIIITTTTKTGQEIAKSAFKDIAVKVTYFPYDFLLSVIMFLDTFQPDKVIIAETEIWPGFVTLAKMRGIKVYTVNGRISPNSYNGYKKIKLLLKGVLNNYEKFFMQTQSDAQRIIDIGANSKKTEVMGNLKFDISKNLQSNQVEELKDSLKTWNFKIIIAASTHKGEDEIVLNSYLDLKKNHPDLKLLLAPRHPQRYNSVEELIKNTKLPYGKRSMNSNFEGNDIIMLDTMGELAKMFSICHTAFIGGSFSQTGGHNPLEASIWDKPVVSGPTVFNFKDIYKNLTETKAAFIVNNQDELIIKLSELLTDKEFYKNSCDNASKIFRENSGAIDFALAKIKE